MKKLLCITLLLLCVLLAGCENVPATTQDTKPSGTTAAPTEPTNSTVPTEQVEPTNSTAPTEPQGVAAPDFTVYDENGKAVKLSDFFGKPIVLNFWASWCPPCKAEMPEFNEKYLELGDRVQFLMIDLVDGYNETMASGAAHIRQQGYEFPVFYDLTQEAAIKYQIRSIPVTYFISAEGKLVTQHVGVLTGEQLEDYLGLIYGG